MTDIYPPTRQRPALQRFAAALDSRASALRRDECGDWAIFGSNGHIYAVPEGFQLMIGCDIGNDKWSSARGWKSAKKRLGFGKVTQDGDCEGSIVLGRLQSKGEAAEIRDILGIPKRVELSEGQLANLRRHAAANAFKPLLPASGDERAAMAPGVNNRVQLTSDGHRPYLQAIEGAFGADIDYATLVKVYGEAPEGQRRYSPAVCTGAHKHRIEGKPDPKHVSTSFVERQNLSMRMGNRRMTRLTNAFSKKAENHTHMMAIYFMHYNFVRIHQTLKVTPAMAAGVTPKLWEMSDMVKVLENWEGAN